MTATKVYGVALGDHFEVVDNGALLKVKEFITPKNMQEPWQAVVLTEAGLEATIEVHDLLSGAYRKVG